MYFFLVKVINSKVLVYFCVVNFIAFILYGYDKFIAGSNKLRVPEKTLHGLALVGGSPAALIAQKFFRHKTVKKEFQIIYWLIVFVQLMLLWFVFFK